MLRLTMAIAILALSIAGCGGQARSPQWIEGRDLYANNCSVCHGSSGDGASAPSLHDVKTTFPSCETHIEWVTLGSENWRQVHGDTYGATDRPITAVMPAHGERLTPEEIALAASFERIEYGELEEASVLGDCGLTAATASAP